MAVGGSLTTVGGRKVRSGVYDRLGAALDPITFCCHSPALPGPGERGGRHAPSVPCRPFQRGRIPVSLCMKRVLRVEREEHGYMTRCNRPSIVKKSNVAT